MSADPQLLRARVLMRARRFAFPVPDALLAVIFAAAAFMHLDTPQLFFVLLAEGGFLLMQGTLVDIATRLKKRPPIWLIPIIVAAVALFSSQSFDLLRYAWQLGAAVFIPLLISLGERGAMLWTMPNRSRIEKIAARALIANRITTGIGLFGLVTLTMVATVALGRDFNSLGPLPMLGAGAIYFAVAAFDEWRVRGPRFAERPRVLFGFDPIHIDYLEPV